MRKAPDQVRCDVLLGGSKGAGRCDGKEGAVRKGDERCVKKIEKGTGSEAGVTDERGCAER